MKWFKHFTDAHRGRSLQAVRRELGMAGIGQYWSLVEACAEKLEKGDDEEFTKEHAKFEFDRATLANIVGVKSGRLEVILNSFSSHSLVISSSHGNVIKIEMPKLLECLDRDSRRARADRAKSKSKKESKSKSEIAPPQISAAQKFESQFNPEMQALRAATKERFGNRLYVFGSEILAHWGSYKNFEDWVLGLEASFNRSPKDCGLINWIEICVKKELGVLNANPA